MRKRLSGIRLGFVIALLIPASPRPASSSEGFRVAPAVDDGFAVLQREGPRNAVLNYMQMGKDALQSRRWDVAAHCFENALLGIEAVYANTEMAARARTLWHEEGAKTFKGEPYERAMAYFYRGLTYIGAGELDNARACFESGMLQDAFAEEEQNRSDFGLLAYISGWCAQQMGAEGLASESFKEVRALRPSCRIPDNRTNVMIIVETGTAPRKLADGIGHGELVFRRGQVWLDPNRNSKMPFDDVQVEISVDGRSYGSGIFSESIYFQAATRGGRPIDRILDGQVRFKRTASELGQVLIDIGYDWKTDTGRTMLGVGGAVSLLAIRARPHADTRYWKNLPDAVHCLPVDLEPGVHELSVEFLDRYGEPIPDMTQHHTVEISQEPDCHLACIFGHEQIFSGGTLPLNDPER